MRKQQEQIQKQQEQIQQQQKKNKLKQQDRLHQQLSSVRSQFQSSLDDSRMQIDAMKRELEKQAIDSVAASARSATELNDVLSRIQQIRRELALQSRNFAEVAEPKQIGAP